jgi:imidazolonepropionase
MAVVSGGLGLAEALAGVTVWAAAALGLPRPRGTLAPGAPADLVIHDIPDWSHIIYHYALSHVKTVLKAGRVVFERAPAP